jgi:hypothetical protein
VTAFSAGRRAAGYSTGEIPIYPGPEDQPTRDTTDRGRAGSGGTADEPTGRKARRRGKQTPPVTDQPAEEAAPRQRRGLFGRRRAAPTPEPAETTDTLDVPTQRGGQPRPEPPLKPRDEEYVDWVSGLSGDTDPRDSSR